GVLDRGARDAAGALSGASGSVAAIPEASVAAEPPAPPAPSVPSLPTLGPLLAGAGSATGSDAAYSRLLARWNVTYTPGAGDACAQAELAGLQCVAQRGSFAQLRVHDRPALLLLGDEQGGAHQVVLTALDGDTARLDIGGAEHTVGIADLARYWFGDFVVLWRPIALPVRALAPGMSGDSVLQLRRSLEQVAGLS